jgi:glycosyltransferase involved in cell wall biosynthesis
MTQPLISIITISYNCADAVEKTIRSVLSQQYPDFEYIVIDGGSTDGTADIIRRHSPNLAYWVSEKDRGISDAFNKGIAAARGRYINLLNSGDTFASVHTLEELAPHLTSPLVTFRFMEENSGEYARLVDENEPDMEKKALLGHQATFVHRDVYTALAVTTVAIRSGWTSIFSCGYCRTTSLRRWTWTSSAITRDCRAASSTACAMR